MEKESLMAVSPSLWSDTPTSISTLQSSPISNPNFNFPNHSCQSPAGINPVSILFPEVASGAGAVVSVSASGMPPSPAPSFWSDTATSISTLQSSPISNPNMQNPNFQILNFQNLTCRPPGGVNPFSILFPEVASGAGTVVAGMPPSAQKRNPPPPDATECRNDEGMRSDVRTTSVEEYQRQVRERKREILLPENESDDDNSRQSRRKSRLLEGKGKCRSEEDMADTLREQEEILEGTRMGTNVNPKVQRSSRATDVNKEKVCNSCNDQNLTNKYALVLKQMRDLFPKTIKEVLSYKINWALCDKHKLHEKVRPWVSNQIMDFIRRNAVTMAESSLECIERHHSLSRLLSMLESCLEDETEMFYLSFCRMLIFEIKKAETEIEFANERSGGGLIPQGRDWSEVKSDNCARDVKKDKIRDSDSYEDLLTLLQSFDLKMLLEVEQFIDTIPRTTEVLFSYDINWSVSNKHELYKKMRPWISQKVEAFEELLEVDGDVLVDYIVSGIEDNISASRMLEMLQVTLKDEAEIFFLDLWRMLIFEIKKLETATEFAKRLSQRGGVWDDVESSSKCARDVSKDEIRESNSYRQLLLLLSREKKHIDVEQFIDEIPKTKEELLSYEINWDLVDKHDLYKIMEPWLSDKFMEVFKKTESSIIDDIVTCIKDHAEFSQIMDLVGDMMEGFVEQFVVGLVAKLIIEMHEVGDQTAESAECTSSANPKEEMSGVAKEINMTSGDRLSQRAREQNDVVSSSTRVGAYNISDREHQLRLCHDKLKLYGHLTKIRILQMAPKSKDELFSYEIKWDVYNECKLEVQMGEWLSSKILAFIGQEDKAPLVVDYILSSLKDHVPASRMLERLQPIVGEESELFVSQMWGVLFVETETEFMFKFKMSKTKLT